MYVNIAGIDIEIHNRYQYIESVCKNYITDKTEPQIVISVTDEDIEYEKKFSDGETDEAYLESVAVFRKFGEKLYLFNGCIFHAAAVMVDGKGYAFTAPSGTGKSTHIHLWKQLYGEKIVIINGDKPILRIIDDKLYVFGSPWSGKECEDTPISAPLAAVCFLARAKNNSIKSVDSENGARRMLWQLYHGTNTETLDGALCVMRCASANVKFYELECTMERSAGRLSYITIKED